VGLRFAKEHGFDFVATFACDTPFFPHDTVARLHLALSDGADCAMPRRNGQVHHTFALVRTTSLDRVDEAFASGMRAIKALGHVLRCAFADFSDNRDGPGGEVFFNINQPDDLIVAERWLAERGP
jgi:molybdopterin-guanine dinucleotide biosynthesis protein A